METNLELPTAVIKLLGNDLCRQIVAALARSDLRIQDLMNSLGEPANLVAYQLGQLRELHLVSERRSTANGRDVYYHLDLEHLRELYLAAGAALHPALVSGIVPVPQAAPPRRLRVLFLCTHNSARSQIAEGILRTISHGAIDAFSAGSEPTAIHELAVHVMAHAGIDISTQRPKHLDEFAGQAFDYVITVCDKVREICPTFLGEATPIHWSFPDPATVAGPIDLRQRAFSQTVAELTMLLRYFLILSEREQKERDAAAARVF